MAKNIISLYQELYIRLISLQNQKKSLFQKLEKLQSDAKKSANELSASIEQKKEQLYNTIRKIEIYISKATQYISPINYTPTAENISPSTLQQLFTMSSDTPNGKEHALILFKKASNCKKFYLDEITHLESEIQQKINNVTNSPAAAIIQYQLTEIDNTINNLAKSSQFSNLVLEIKRRSKDCTFDKIKGNDLPVPTQSTDALCFGFADFPFPIDNNCQDIIAALGKYYSLERKTITLPLCFAKEDILPNQIYAATKISLTYNNQTLDDSYTFIQGLMFNILRSYTPLQRRIVYIDLETFNPEYLGVMKFFTGNESLIHFATDAKNISTVLNRLATDTIEEKESNRARRYLIIRGYLSGSSQSDYQATLTQLCNNTQKNNITIIFIDKENNHHCSAKDIDITMPIISKEDGFVTSKWGAEIPVKTLSFPSQFDISILDNFKNAYKPKKLNNLYENFFKLNPDAPYTRKRKPINLPYSVNSKGEVLFLEFEKMCFASYIMGASGSGKSTLLHTLIAGILQNYHPDEVELWLADFKKTEFTPYARHTPPHVKYILMDSSAEMICDFIDKLYNELETRKSFIANHNRKDRIDLPTDVYLPAIFIIIDEFSNMSTVIKNNETYKEKLEALLREGRSNGFRFIFAAQSYISGAPALTTFSKLQIGSRIAMKNTKEEIKETLCLPSSQYTEKLNYEIDTIPPYYTLHHWQASSGEHHVDKALTLYFDGSNDNSWESRFNFIEKLKKRMKPVELCEYDGSIIDQYVDKKTRIVSSDQLEVFNPLQIATNMKAYRNNSNCFLADSDILVSFGLPCKLDKTLFPVITDDQNENIFLLTTNKESPCAMSVTLSTIRSFLLQNQNIQVWAHPKNQIYHTYKDTVFCNPKISCSIGVDDVRNSISTTMDKIQQGKKGKELIILLGMEQIYPKLCPTSQSNSYMQAYNQAALLFANADDEMDKHNEMLAQGITKKESNQTTNSSSNPAPNNPQIKKTDNRKYNQEFLELIHKGSEYGYHFMLCLNNFTLLKTMSLKMENFNHRLSFKTDTADTSISVFNTSAAYKLSEHTCYYSAFGFSGEKYNLIPYLHKNVVWDKWALDQNNLPYKKT